MFVKKGPLCAGVVVVATTSSWRHHVKAFKKKIDGIGYNIYKNSANCKKLAASMHRRHVVKRTKLMNWYHKNKMILWPSIAGQASVGYER